MVMVIPLIILAVLSICAGWINVTGAFSQFMGHGGSHGGTEEINLISGFFGILSHPLPLISLIVALLGIFLAYALYCVKWISAEKIGQVFKPVYIMLSHKYWFDDLYENIIVKKILYNGIFKALAMFDSSVVDGTVNGIAQGTASIGGSLRKLETGQTQLYAITIAIGIIAIAVCLYLFS